MFNLRQMMRMARWARNPPSEKRVKFVFAVILICLVLFGIDRIFGWPEFLTIENVGRRRF